MELPGRRPSLVYQSVVYYYYLGGEFMLALPLAFVIVKYVLLTMQ